MKIENVYKCLRCGKLETVAPSDGFRVLPQRGIMKTNMIIDDEPLTHRCDPTNNKQIGILQKVGFNVIEG